MSKNCHVIQDLMPLYVDDVISEESRKMVEEHLASCESCQRQAEALKQSLNIPMEQDASDLKGMKKKYRMSIWLRVLLIAIGMLVLWIGLAVTLMSRWSEVFPKANLQDIKDCTEIVIIGDRYYLHTNELFGCGVPVFAGSENDSDYRFYLGENGIHNLGLGRSYIMGESLYPVGTVGKTKRIIYAKPDGSGEIVLYEEGDTVTTLEGTLKQFDE